MGHLLPRLVLQDAQVLAVHAEKQEPPEEPGTHTMDVMESQEPVGQLVPREREERTDVIIREQLVDQEAGETPDTQVVLVVRARVETLVQVEHQEARGQLETQDAQGTLDGDARELAVMLVHQDMDTQLWRLLMVPRESLEIVVTMGIQVLLESRADRSCRIME